MLKLLARSLVFAVCCTFPHFAATSSPPKVETLTLFVKGSAEGMSIVRDEVARLMQPTGFTVEWKNLEDRRAGEDFPHLATVDFRGNCTTGGVLPSSFARQDVRSLASTAVVDRQVLPFSAVHCDALRAVLAPALATARREEKSGLFARAAARVIAHELFHMLAQTTSHGSRGVSKSCFGLTELTAERFAFDHETVAQMRPPVIEPAEQPSWFEDIGGR